MRNNENDHQWTHEWLDALAIEVAVGTAVPLDEFDPWRGSKLKSKFPSTLNSCWITELTSHSSPPWSESKSRSFGSELLSDKRWPMTWDTEVVPIEEIAPEEETGTEDGEEWGGSPSLLTATAVGLDIKRVSGEILLKPGQERIPFVAAGILGYGIRLCCCLTSWWLILPADVMLGRVSMDWEGEREGDKFVRLKVALDWSGRKEFRWGLVPEEEEAGTLREVKVIVLSMPAEAWKKGSLPFLEREPEPLLLAKLLLLFPLMYGPDVYPLGVKVIWDDAGESWEVGDDFVFRVRYDWGPNFMVFVIDSTNWSA